MHVKTRTRFICILIMPMYGYARIFLFELRHQSTQRGFLLGCPGVFGLLIVGGHATDIAHADTVSVLPLAVRTDFGDIAPLVYATIPVYHIVVAYAIKTTVTVPAVYVSYCVVFPLRGCATVYYHLVYLSHLRYCL